MADRAITKQARDFCADSLPNISCSPVDNDIFHWKGILIGPVDTPYEGGIFKFDMYFRIDYPFNPPRVIFETKIFHPNITTTGYVHLDILKSQWNPALNISAVLLSISALLDCPNSDICANLEAGKLYRENQEEYKKQVREWTLIYANDLDLE